MAVGKIEHLTSDVTPNFKTPGLVRLEQGYEWRSKFHIGQRIIIDGDVSIQAVVIGIYFGVGCCKVEAAWFHCGEQKTGYFDEMRVTAQ